MPQQQAGGIVFRVAAYLTHFQPLLAESRRDIGRRRGFTYAALPVDRNFFHRFLLRCLLFLQLAF